MVWWDLGPRIQIEYVCYFPLEQYHNVCFFFEHSKLCQFQRYWTFGWSSCHESMCKKPRNYCLWRKEINWTQVIFFPLNFVVVRFFFVSRWPRSLVIFVLRFTDSVVQADMKVTWFAYTSCGFFDHHWLVITLCRPCDHQSFVLLSYGLLELRQDLKGDQSLKLLSKKKKVSFSLKKFPPWFYKRWELPPKVILEKMSLEQSSLSQLILTTPKDKQLKMQVELPIWKLRELSTNQLVFFPSFFFLEVPIKIGQPKL